MADKSVRTTSKAIDDLSQDWEMIDALMDGTPAMREGATKFLPKWPSEDDESYAIRLSSAVLHPVFKRTVLINAARPFSRPVTYGDQTPQRVLDFSENIDLEGTGFAAFCAQLMVACLSKGLIGVLVDFPPNGAKTMAEEKAAGARPYAVKYPANSILGWKTEKVDGGFRLAQLRLLEFVDEDDGAFATKSVEQVRVLTPGTWTLYRENDKKEWVIVEEGTTTLNFVPFVFFYGMQKSYGVGISPLSDLAHQNVEHYQSASDQQTILHVARVPILFAKLFGDSILKLGAGSAACVNDEKADLKYVEHSGAAIGAGKESMTALEDRMRATGAELISLDPGFATATEVAADGDASKSLLQQICENFEKGAAMVLNYLAEWIKEAPTAEVSLYKDFGVAVDADASTLGSAVNNGTLSKQSHFEELKRRDIISHERTWEDETDRLNQQMSAEDSRDLAKQKQSAAIASANSI